MQFHLGVIISYLDLPKHASNPQIDSDHLVIESAYIIRKVCTTERLAARILKQHQTLEKLCIANDFCGHPQEVLQEYRWATTTGKMRPAIFSVISALCDHPSLRAQLINDGILQYCIDQLIELSCFPLDSDSINSLLFRDTMLLEEETCSIILGIICTLGTDCTEGASAILRTKLHLLVRFTVYFIEFTHRREALAVFGLLLMKESSLISDQTNAPWLYLVKGGMVTALCDIIEYSDRGDGESVEWIDIKSTASECLCRAVNKQPAKSIFISRCGSGKILDSFEELSLRSVHIFRCFTGILIVVFL